MKRVRNWKWLSEKDKRLQQQHNESETGRKLCRFLGSCFSGVSGNLQSGSDLWKKKTAIFDSCRLLWLWSLCLVIFSWIVNSLFSNLSRSYGNEDARTFHSLFFAEKAFAYISLIISKCHATLLKDIGSWCVKIPQSDVYSLLSQVPERCGFVLPLFPFTPFLLCSTGDRSLVYIDWSFWCSSKYNEMKYAPVHGVVLDFFFAVLVSFGLCMSWTQSGMGGILKALICIKVKYSVEGISIVSVQYSIFVLSFTSLLLNVNAYKTLMMICVVSMASNDDDLCR